MIAERQQCLDRATLADLLAGKLPAERFAMAMEHVDACEKCRQVAETQSSSGDAWLAAAAEDHTAGEFDSESQCQAIVGQLLISPPAQTKGADAASPESAPGVPRELLGPYRLLRRLGAGGMGAVYLAEHLRLRKQVAIKLLPRDKLLQSGWLERFNREMTSVAALENPHIVRALDAGDEDNWHYLVMEYLDGLDLGRLCRRLPDIPVEAACELVRQAAMGLSAIHSSGMIHRDIKPSNLFLTQVGIVKLLDLGLVLDGQSPLATDERLTTVGHLMGTLPYMPREQLSDARAIDHRADIYSLGATLYRLLVGRPPFTADSLPRTIQAISTDDCQPLAAHRSDLSSALCSLVDSMLSHDIDQRPQSADAVAEALSPFCDGADVKSLIQAAMRCDPASDELPSLYSHGDFLQPSPPAPPSKRWSWLMAACLPLVFLAGIMLTISTDRGTLSIESDAPGVTVKVTQGDKLVESLEVQQTSPSQVRLRSGRYTIELDGVESDRLVISDRDIAITRGDKVMVKVTRGEPTNAESARGKGPPIDLTHTNMSFVPGGTGYLKVLKNASCEVEFDQPIRRVRNEDPSRLEVTPLPGGKRIQITGFTTGKSRVVFFSEENRIYTLDVEFVEIHAGQSTSRIYDVRGLDLQLAEKLIKQELVEAPHARIVPYPANASIVVEALSPEHARVMEVLEQFRKAVAGSADADEQASSPARLFQGKPLSHWMEVLVRDQDNETLGLAMQAVVLLAESDEEKLAAARQLLVPARRLGGVVQSGRPSDSNQFTSGFFLPATCRAGS